MQARNCLLRQLSLQMIVQLYSCTCTLHSLLVDSWELELQPVFSMQEGAALSFFWLQSGPTLRIPSTMQAATLPAWPGMQERTIGETTMPRI